MNKIFVSIHHSNSSLITRGELNIGEHKNIVSYLREQDDIQLLPITQILNEVTFVLTANISFIESIYKPPHSLYKLSLEPMYVEIAVHTAGRTITGLFRKNLGERTSDSLNRIRGFFVVLSKGQRKDEVILNYINLKNVVKITPMKNA